jgi:hypothetical protein
MASTYYSRPRRLLKHASDRRAFKSNHCSARWQCTCSLILFITSIAPVAAAPVATYRFNDSLAADEQGVPSLVAVDPLGTNSFEEATVKGVTQRVFHWRGSASPATSQAGLTLDATGLVPYDNYSIEMIFEFLEPAQAGGGWRRIVDTQNRQSDNGFYVEPGNRLQVYPVVTGSTLFTTPGFHHVVLSNLINGNQREVKASLDGVLQLTSDTDQLNLDNSNNPGHLISFFLDNIAGPAQNEFADGRIAFLQIHSGILEVGVPGDYNGNDVVDAADYVEYRRHQDQTYQLGNEVNGITPGQVTPEDLTEWRARFGNSGGAGLNAAAVPEPPAIALLMLGVALAGSRKRAELIFSSFPVRRRPRVAWSPTKPARARCAAHP